MGRASVVHIATEDVAVVMKKQPSGRKPLLSVRVPPDLLKRADRLVAKLGRDARITAIGAVSRSTIINLALLRGLESLEGEYK